MLPFFHPSCQDFLAGFSSTEPINILLVVTEAGRDSCKLPFKTTTEDKAEMQEVTVSLADANQISMNVAVAAILPEMDDIFTLQKKQSCCLLARLAVKTLTGSFEFELKKVCRITSEKASLFHTPFPRWIHVITKVNLQKFHD